MPVRQICEAARSKGVITVVDGAHMNGQVPMRIDELGCDYYAGSPHKWMFAPAGCGILWGREEMLDKLWPSIVTGGWDDRKLKAARFMRVGTNNRAIFEGMLAGIRFYKSVGVERIQSRIHELARLVRRKAVDSGRCELLTPETDSQYGALVWVRLKGVSLDRFGQLCAKRRIWVSRGQQIRLSTHIHTRVSDIDIFFETLAQSAV
jgi:selenocysteine lyase/cysteine desulfurase